MSIFNSVPIRVPKKTPFNLSHGCKLSGNFGRLYPFACRKVVAGDRLVFLNQSFSQFATMATKVYQEFNVKVERFFVPSRLLWDDFVKFFSSDESETFVHPYFQYDEIILTGLAYHGSLFDYFNLPTFWYPANFQRNDYPWSSSEGYDWTGHMDDLVRLRSIYQQQGDTVYHLDALKFIAFVMIYSQYYADENLQSNLADWEVLHDDFQNYIATLNSNLTSVIIKIATDWSLKVYNRNYPKDYFTGALPFAQKGPQVNVPFTGNGFTEFFADDAVASTALDPANNFRTLGFNSDGSHPYPGVTRIGPLLRSGTSAANVTNNGAGNSGTLSNRVVMQNGVTSIEDLRTAILLQEFYEKQARSGTRFKETLLAHFGTYNHDARLQRAEFLQSVTTKMTVGNVYSTSANTSDTGVTGEPVSVVNGAGLSRKRKFRVSEPGYIINLVSVYPKASYYKGIPKEWMELDKFDYLWPDFQHLGEQEVKIAEISLGNTVSGNDAYKDSAVFGYNPRYAQYRCALDEVHGDFRDSRKSMTASRDFTTDVQLSSGFISIDPQSNNLNRIFSYMKDNVDHFDIDINEILYASRPLDYYGIPRFTF